MTDKKIHSISGADRPTFTLMREFSIGGDASCDAIEFLASRLYWKENQLDPDLDDEPGWDDLRERDRDFYRTCVIDLLGF